MRTLFLIDLHHFRDKLFSILLKENLFLSRKIRLDVFSTGYFEDDIDYQKTQEI